MVLVIAAAAVGGAVIYVAAVLLHRKMRQRAIAGTLRIGSASEIDEERYVSIGGIEQWIGIRGEDRRNPVLLIIHGGPGASCSIFTPRIRAWERYFTIVQWDQRGSGKTLGRTGKGGTGELTMERLIRDGIEVAEYVRERLEQEKVILLGTSFGSMFALGMARRRPDLFSAYVGTDQNVGMTRRREEMHRGLVERLRAGGLDKGAAIVEGIGADAERWSADDYMAVAKWTLKSDRTSRQIMKMLKDSIWYSPLHRLRDIRHFVAGMHFSLRMLLADAVRYDAWADGSDFDVPFFVFQGENDVVTMTSLVQDYFDDVAAPVKEMALIRNAGHFAAFMQPEQFLSELLTRVRPLAAASRSTALASPR